jgi:hypothetical protein
VRGVIGVVAALAVGLSVPAGAAADQLGSHARAARAVAAAADGFPLALSDSVPLPSDAGATYDDPAGDTMSGLAPDILRTSVWSDATGLMTFSVAIPNVPVVRDRDFYALFLDTDRDSATGNLGAGGADYAIAIHGATRTVGLARWHAGVWDFDTPQASLAAAWTSGPAIRIDRAELGGTAALRFWQGASWTDTAGQAASDYAPEPGGWDYVLPGLEALPPPPADSAAPDVHALRATGRTGGFVGLRYRLHDDNGWTRERVRIFRAGGRLLWTYRTELAQSEDGVVYWVPWHAPRGVGLHLRFCVRAWDEAGNGSRRSCAPLRLHRR